MFCFVLGLENIARFKYSASSCECFSTFFWTRGLDSHCFSPAAYLCLHFAENSVGLTDDVLVVYFHRCLLHFFHFSRPLSCCYWPAPARSFLHCDLRLHVHRIRSNSWLFSTSFPCFFVFSQWCVFCFFLLLLVQNVYSSPGLLYN